MEDAERALRRKMRVFPPLADSHPQSQRQAAKEDARRWDDARRTAIISVSGKDLSSEDEIKKALREFDDKEGKDKAA
jgi:hypothetical protein